MVGWLQAFGGGLDYVAIGGGLVTGAWCFGLKKYINHQINIDYLRVLVG